MIYAYQGMLATRDGKLRQSCSLEMKRGLIHVLAQVAPLSRECHSSYRSGLSLNTKTIDIIDYI